MSEVSVGVLKAVANPHRLEACWQLARGESSLSDVAAHLGISRPLVAHHLGILLEAGLVEARRETPWTFYRLRPALLSHLVGELSGLLDASRSTQAEAGGKPDKRRRSQR